MAMHISQYCEVFDMKHLWSIWMHLNQLYVAKKYRLLWKLTIEAFASLSTWLSWYFDRDKYKLWFRSRRLTPFNQFVSHYCQSMTQLACDCHPFFTHRNLQSNGWNIFRYWRQTAWLATAMLVADASRVLLIAAFIGISSSYPNGWLQRLKHSKLRFYILALINDYELQISRTYDKIKDIFRSLSWTDWYVTGAPSCSSSPRHGGGRGWVDNFRIYCDTGRGNWLGDKNEY